MAVSCLWPGYTKSRTRPALWLGQRHRLFHMDAQGVNTRVLESRDVAVALVNDVLDTIEVAHQHIEGTKGGT
ncbi:hypothetical protein DGM93_00520 [Xanthomonas phaseoli pv. phaseoli]|nr:hypothetical protein DGM93_00520 [Xanthomonas phaseoli pv. phaseoli]QWN31436.1 hypothetical protein DGM81_00525 [Xanthomonas phaseoli pv. phaseoli]